MIKKLLSFSLIFIINQSINAQAFNGMYHFTGVMTGSASTGTVDPTPPPTANGVTFGAFTANGFTASPSANGVFAWSAWPLGATNGDDMNFSGAIDPARYFEVTLTPNGGNTVTINSINFNMSRSATGPRNWAVRGNADTYAANLQASIVTSNTNITTQAANQFFWALDSYTVTGGKQEVGSSISPGTSYAGQTNPMTFRFYAWNAEGNAGTFRIDTVVFNGFTSVIAGTKKIDYDLNSAFKIFPNPSKDGAVTIKSNNITFQAVEVYNALGQLVTRRKNEGNYQFKLDVSEFSKGAYFIKIISDEKVFTERIIITE